MNKYFQRLMASVRNVVCEFFIGEERDAQREEVLDDFEVAEVIGAFLDGCGFGDSFAKHGAALAAEKVQPPLDDFVCSSKCGEDGAIETGGMNDFVGSSK